MRKVRRLFVASVTAVLGVTATVALTGALTAPSAIAAGTYTGYVALGDSYTAGPDIRPQQAGAPLACGRSELNYPSLVAGKLGARLTDMSCSGAVTANLTTVAQGLNPPQIDGVGPATSLVTVSIGGNDDDLFMTLMTACRLDNLRPHLSPAPCQARLGGFVPGILRQTQAKISAVLQAIHARAPAAAVLVIGYPRLIPATGTCAALPFAPGDYQWIDSDLRGLSTAMSEAVASDNGGSTFVDTYGPSLDHSACAADPWINGMTSGQDGSAPDHPNARGMAATASAIVAALRARP
jgi:lysophospholipase L1-like esterase